MEDSEERGALVASCTRHLCEILVHGTPGYLFLHNQTALLLKGRLLFERHIVVTSVPHHLRR